MCKIEFDEIEIVTRDIERTALAVFAAIACGGALPQTAEEPSVRLLAQGGVRFRLVRADAARDDEETQFVRRHGTAIRDVGLRVADVSQTADRVVAAGGSLIHRGDAHAIVALFDGVRHTLKALPTVEDVASPRASEISTDHVAICVRREEF